MISLSRVYGHKAVYLLLLSIFTLVWELAVAAKAYADAPDMARGVMPSGACADISQDPACRVTKTLLEEIAKGRLSAIQSILDRDPGNSSIQHVTYGALILMGRSSREYFELLRVRYKAHGETHVAFVRLRASFRQTGGSFPEVPVAELKATLGIDPGASSAFIPDLFLAVVTGDAQAFRYLVTTLGVRPETIRDNAGNGIAHYLAQFATEEFRDSVSDLLPRPDGLVEPNEVGYTPMDILQNRGSLVPTPTESRTVTGLYDWLGLQDQRPFEMALAQ